MIKEQDEHMFFLLFNTNFIWMAASYQIPHGLWNIIHLSPFIATRALSTFLYSLHILYIKHILVSRFIISFYLFFNQSYWYLPIFPIVPIYIYFIALHILQSGLLVPASIPWSSCCLSFLLYKHCEYPKISDTGVATFFFTKSLFPLYVQYIFIYLYIFENKGTSLFLTSTVSLHQLVVRNSLTHYCCWAFIDLTLAVEYDISKLLNIFDDVKFIRNRRKKGI